MKLEGSKPKKQVFKTENAPGITNYFLAHIPKGITGNKSYCRAVSNDVYYKIDMQTYSNSHGIKFYYIIHPGGNADDIIMRFDGADAINITADGGLEIVTSIGKMKFDPGHAYQLNPGGNPVPMPWQAKFIALGNKRVKFDIRQYAANMPLFIQVDRGHSMGAPPPPVNNIEWSIYYGSSSFDVITKTTVDVGGNFLCTGFTQSPSFPVTAGVVQGNFGKIYDAFVLKFKSTAERVFATFYGGEDAEYANCITTDPDSNIYFAGRTGSDTFPTFNPGGGAFFLGNKTASTVGFIVSLNPKGTGLRYATYFNDSLTAGFTEIFDIYYSTANSHLFAVGSGPFPKKAMAAAFNDSVSVGGIAEFRSATFQLLWSSQFGNTSSSGTIIKSIVTDKDRNIFITGAVFCQTPPVTEITCNVPDSGAFPLCNPGAPAYFQTSFVPGDNHAFVAQFDATRKLVWSSLIAGNREDIGYSIAIDSLGYLYIGGRTYSTLIGTPSCQPPANGFPICNANSMAFLDTIGGSLSTSDGFICKFAPIATLTAGKELIWSSFWGSQSYMDYISGIAVSPNGNLFITGRTSSPGLITVPHSNFYYDNILTNTIPDYSAFIGWFSPDGIPVWVSYIEGTNNKTEALAISYYNNNTLYIAGRTNSTAYLYACPSALAYCDSTWNGSYDGFITRFTSVVTGIKEISSGKTNDYFMVYPNPTKGDFSITLNIKDISDVDALLTNIIGQTVFEKKWFKQCGVFTNTFTLSGMSQGIYMLRVKTNTQIHHSKIIYSY